MLRATLKLQLLYFLLSPQGWIRFFDKSSSGFLLLFLHWPLIFVAISPGLNHFPPIKSYFSENGVFSHEPYIYTAILPRWVAAHYITVEFYNTTVVSSLPHGNCKTRRDRGRVKDVPCIFPFTYDKVTYNSCTWDLSHLTKGPWCSTKVDARGQHVKKNWGLCTASGDYKCPIPPGGESFQNSKLPERSLVFFDVQAK